MEQTINKNCIYNLELQSLHYWYKRTASQNPLINNILKIMQNTIYETNIIGTSIQHFTK